MEEDLEKTQILNRSLETPFTEPSEALPPRQRNCRAWIAGAFRIETEKKEEEFRVGQSRILQKLAANAPLSEILERLVLLIEAQSPGMLCSVLLLSEDGEHVRHGAAPSLPPEYVKAIDGSADWTKARFVWHCDVSRRAGGCDRHSYRFALGRLQRSRDRAWPARVLVHADTVRSRESARFVCDVLS